MKERQHFLDSDFYDIARTCHELASHMVAVGDFDEAAALYEQALAIKRRVLGPGHPEVAATLHNLALLRQRTGSIEEARALWAEARTILESSSGDNGT